jgi:hypothetical protein
VERVSYQLPAISRGGTVTQLMWLPMLAFEVPLGPWLLIKGVKGVAPQATRGEEINVPVGRSPAGPPVGAQYKSGPRPNRLCNKKYLTDVR